MNIGKNLRRLRRQRDLTQDELAKFLGLSFQAVSKWECGDCYPDITFLPILSNFFGVTVDELLGMNELRDNTEIEKTLEASYALAADGKSAQRIDMMREAVKRYPASHALWFELARALTFIFHIDAEALQRNQKEAAEIFERILERCTDTGLRNKTQAALCYLYDALGQREQAANIAKELPAFWDSSLIYANFLPVEERLERRRWNMLRLAESIDEQIFHLHYNGEYDALPIEERIAILHKSIALFELIFEDGEYWHLAVNMSEKHYWLAQAYVQIEDYETALQMLEKSVAHAIMYDNQPEKAVYTSVLLRGLEFERSCYGKDYPESWCQVMLSHLKATQFDPIRTEPRFIAVENKLRKNTQRF
ncbi:MAG: helix-turn-helix transcriptional regulator [Oscillospiraceae bacterium]|nr:helix-turn-helix transcriptional regulator [Oscillospiraceae bacterium]